MTPLHHDRLLVEGTAPAPGARTPLGTAAAPSPRRTPRPVPETADPTIPTQRSGDAQLLGTIGTDRPAEDRTPELAEVTDLAGLTGLAEATARAGIEDLTDVRAEDAAPTGAASTVVAVPRSGRGRRLRFAPPSAARRPAVFLAVALVGATGLALVTAGDHVAQADAPEAETASVSVAAELGLDQQSQSAVIEDDAAARLEQMTASRTAREAEQAAAAQVQADADRLASEAAAEAARPDAVLPVSGARLTSGFGARWGTQHAGIDLAAPMLTPEYAAMDGIVLEAGPASGYGNVVYVQHENGDVTVYGHMEEILVSPGQVVQAGETIALLGNRGQSTGPHLHFEVHVGGLNGQKIDPIPWLRDRGVAV
ncbi:peptidoglycan DD-metalloendopeptidase family protein [Geodermatophilus sabuli]|uniref:Peptidoglycan DD-metalloendopeptidase family protein n=1 Tax=Geodermatophilus sabuli TaxID=1564158 RepID=A0A7K3W2R8_9ACTN|nr:M23 family metallopeptidase [Geodermatophilus sabuli]NEK59191.1 peptidoglycan DD-metalloendopeptidase family protein [Geodermatophilus sabuli]